MRAGLLLPVARFHKALRKGRYAKEISDAASVYMTATIEYLCVEILEGAEIEAKKSHKYRITPRHITLSIRQDEELNVLFKDAIFAQGGVVPLIHQELEKKNTAKPKRDTRTNSVNYI